MTLANYEDIPHAIIICSCGSKFSDYLEFSKHVNALNDFDLVTVHDWLERQVKITQNQMDVRGIKPGESHGTT